jgi:hypothetical protein
MRKVCQPDIPFVRPVMRNAVLMQTCEPKPQRPPAKHQCRHLLTKECLKWASSPGHHAPARPQQLGDRRLTPPCAALAPVCCHAVEGCKDAAQRERRMGAQRGLATLQGLWWMEERVPIIGVQGKGG